jgi:hypothetical protein
MVSIQFIGHKLLLAIGFSSQENDIRRAWVKARPAAARKILVVASRYHRPQCARSISHISPQAGMKRALVNGKRTGDKPNMFTMFHNCENLNKWGRTKAVQPKNYFQMFFAENSAGISQVVDIARRLNVVADSDFSPPLCSVEMPLTALLVAGLTPSGSDRFTPLLSACANDLRPPARASFHSVPQSESGGDRLGGRAASPAQHKAIAARLRHGQDLGNSRERGQLSFIPLIFRYISFRSRALQSQNCPPSLTRPILA